MLGCASTLIAARLPIIHPRPRLNHSVIAQPCLRALALLTRSRRINNPIVNIYSQHPSIELPFWFSTQLQVMEIHMNPVFPSAFTIATCYSRPYCKTWPDLVLQPPDGLTGEHSNQMQLLRFPTPPITPPKIYPQLLSSTTTTWSSNSSSSSISTSWSSNCCNIGKSEGVAGSPSRTQTVIMKVGHDHHGIAAISPAEISTESKTDSRSSGSASPNSDYICEWQNCGRCFGSLEKLATHVTQAHAVSSPIDGLYYCRWMGCLRTDRGFNARYKMLVHVRTHTKEKPHHCDICDKSFSRAENLKIHIRSHSGEKPYVCTFEGCNKAYSNSSDRFKHTRTHSMEKPYMCKVPGCNKRYTDPSSLRKHVKTFKHPNNSGNNPNAAINVVQLPVDHSSGAIATNGHSPYSESSSSNYAPCLKEEDNRPTFLYTPPLAPIAATVGPVAPHYYMGELCHKEDSPALDYMFIRETPAYWLSRSPECQPKYGLDMDIDMPLDLRVNRS